MLHTRYAYAVMLGSSPIMVPEDRIWRASFAGHPATSIGQEVFETRSTEVLINRLETQPAAQVILLSPHDVKFQEKKKKEKNKKKRSAWFRSQKKP